MEERVTKIEKKLRKYKERSMRKESAARSGQKRGYSNQRPDKENERGLASPNHHN